MPEPHSASPGSDSPRSGNPDSEDLVLPPEEVFDATPPAPGMGSEAIIEEEVVETAEQFPAPGLLSAGGKICGPGLLESVVWLLGVLVVQAGASLVAAILLVVLHMLSTGNVVMDMHAASELISRNMLVVVGFAQISTLLYCTGAVAFRLRPHGLARLGLQSPRMLHLFLIATLTLPLSLLCSPLQSLILEALPGSDGGLMDALEDMKQAPLGVILLVIAVVPALAEELLFRGLIGRGLIARWGTVAGVLVTSVLFGAIHLNLAQGLAVIPLGIAMHCVYLATRSIWAPVLLHFLNNSFAAVTLKYGEDFAPEVLVQEHVVFPAELLAVSAAVVTAVALLLWQTRVRRAAPVENESDASALNATDAHAANWASPPARPLLIACGIFNLLGFMAVIWRLA